MIIFEFYNNDMKEGTIQIKLATLQNNRAILVYCII